MLGIKPVFTWGELNLHYNTLKHIKLPKNYTGIVVPFILLWFTQFVRVGLKKSMEIKAILVSDILLEGKWNGHVGIIKERF